MLGIDRKAPHIRSLSKKTCEYQKCVKNLLKHATKLLENFPNMQKIYQVCACLGASALMYCALYLKKVFCCFFCIIEMVNQKSPTEEIQWGQIRTEHQMEPYRTLIPIQVGPYGTICPVQAGPYSIPIRMRQGTYCQIQTFH